jgi:hypothetical protein
MVPVNVAGVTSVDRQRVSAVRLHSQRSVTGVRPKGSPVDPYSRVVELGRIERSSEPSGLHHRVGQLWTTNVFCDLVWARA